MKRDINAITGYGRKQGNGAHVMVPKEWIGMELYVKPLVKVQEDEAKEAFKHIHVPRGRRKK